ncbi:ABC transporter ATP-binding protein/permease [Candidatus Thioglobus sp.]|nr:ABC transporter ATP-binding protein [Candidatus Thioglobus sp.]MDA8872022.1 ABC transporter ATP-binding protein/permease [Candidatus Thioglobus sp.]
MNFKKTLRQVTAIEFVMLAPRESVFIMIGSIVSGLLQSASILALFPLMKYLDSDLEQFSNPLITGYFDRFFYWMGMDNSLIAVLGFMVLATWGIRWIDYFIRSYCASVSAKIVKNLRQQIIESVMSASWSYFVNKRVGYIIHSVITETGKTVSGYNDAIRFFSAILQGGVLLITTFMLSPFISLIVAITGAVLVILFTPWIKYAKQVAVKTGKLLQEITSRITDTLHGLKPLKAMNNDRFLLPILNRETVDLEKQQFRGFLVYQLPVVLRDSVIVLVMATVAYVSLEYSIIEKANLLPMLLLFGGAVRQLASAQGVYQSQKGMEPYYASLKENIAEARRMSERVHGNISPVFKEKIIIKDISFSYGEVSVLRNTSMVINKKSFIAIMGESGGGKTTFTDILCALYKPNSGEIFIDDDNLQSLDINKWRQMIGYVPQDLVLFHDSIANNVNLGDVSISNEKIKEALQDSGAWTFVESLPEGMNTIIGERGIRLSGGQRQRISIARAIVRGPELLILDEATTALDPETEERILKTIRGLTKKGITAVAVSHQTAVLDIADQVFKLENGKFKKISSMSSK